MAARKRLPWTATHLVPLLFLLGLALYSNNPNLQTAFQASVNDLVWSVVEKQEMDGSGDSKEQENTTQQEANQDADTTSHADNKYPSLWQCPHLPTLHFSGDEPEEQEMLRNRYNQRYGDQHGVEVDNLPPPVLETIPQGRLLVYPGNKGSTASAWNEERQIITPDRGFLTYVAPPTNETLSTLPVRNLTGDYFAFPQRFQDNFGHFLHDHLPGLAWANHILPKHTSFLLMEDSKKAREPLTFKARERLTFIDPDFVKRVTWIQKGTVVQVTGNLYTFSDWKRFGKDIFGAQRLWITSQKPMAPLPPKNKKVIFYTRKSNDTQHGRIMDTKNEQEILDLIHLKMVEYGRDNEELVIFNGQENGETMSLEHQFQLFKSASTVIGPHGSGMANIVWLPESQSCDDRPRVLEFLARAPGEGQFHIQNGGPGKTYYYLFSTAPWVEYHHMFYTNHSTSDNMFVSLGNVAEALDTMWGGNPLAPALRAHTDVASSVARKKHRID
jgi:hypothetical protein